MIRVIVLFIGLTLIWVWLGSPFPRKAKITISLVALFAAVALVVYEVHSNKPRIGLVQQDQLKICGLKVDHSYRTDFKVNLCFENLSSATVKRVEYRVSASQCNPSGECEVLEKASRDRVLTITPLSTVTVDDTLRFDSLNPNSKLLSWQADVLSIKAVP